MVIVAITICSLSFWTLYIFEYDRSARNGSKFSVGEEVVRNMLLERFPNHSSEDPLLRSYEFRTSNSIDDLPCPSCKKCDGFTHQFSTNQNYFKTCNYCSMWFATKIPENIFEIRKVWMRKTPFDENEMMMHENQICDIKRLHDIIRKKMLES